MNETNKSYIIKFLIISSIFLFDQITKYYVVNFLKVQNHEIYLTSFLNIYLIWNNGIAFGLFGFEDQFFYNFITFSIIVVLIIILFVLVKTNDLQSYFYAMIFGGACGNLLDRLRFSSVPDFIDFHIHNFHWFIFNVADIFISVGVFCLIIAEIFLNKEKIK
jgi:signal peptidase II|tara:strand:- start:83 stop:568 length:486 start_codon:yes stop_codon:yes gene_type:complete